MIIYIYIYIYEYFHKDVDVYKDIWKYEYKHDYIVIFEHTYTVHSVYYILCTTQSSLYTIYYTL